MSDPYIGQITIFAGNFAPRGWAFCQGQLLSISQNTALFSLLGTTYGGNGSTNFGLPNLQGRAALHPGNGPGLSPHIAGELAGSESATLLINNLPSHNHGVAMQMRAEGRAANATSAAGNMLAGGATAYRASVPAEEVAMDAAMVAVTQDTVGSGQSYTHMPPYLGLNYIIALVGVYPSRN